MATAQDRMHVIELMGRYNQALDRRDSEVWSQTFTEDGWFESKDTGEVRGRSALRAMVDKMARPSLERHWAGNFIFVSTDNDELELTADMAVLKGNRILTTGEYHTQMKMVDGAWKIYCQQWIRAGSQ